MAKFRKRPIVIEAVQVWANSEWPTNVRYDENQGGFAVYDKLHDTWVKFESGDWIITGVQGETYPCKPDVFAITYEAITACEHQHLKWADGAGLKQQCTDCGIAF